MRFILFSALASHPWLVTVLAALAALVVGNVVVPDAGDGGAGSGGAPADGDAGNNDPDDHQADADLDGDHLGGHDSDDDDDDDDADLPDDVRNDPKRLRTRHRRLQRQLGRARPILERFRDPATGKFMDARQIDLVLSRAREMEEFEPLLEQHPDLVQEILARKSGRRPAAAGDAEDAFVDPFADPERVPWDTNTESGRALVEHLRRGAKENHDLRRDVRDLKSLLTQLTEREGTRTIEQHEGQWKGLCQKAALDVPEHARRTFVNSVRRAFELLKAQNRLGKVDPRRVIADELAPFKSAFRGQQRRTVADAQRRAETTKNLPAPQRARTAPAGAHDTNTAGTIRDGRKSFFQRIGMSTPPAGR